MVSSSIKPEREALRAAGYTSRGVCYFDYVRDQAVAQLEGAGHRVVVIEDEYTKLVAPPVKAAGYEQKKVWEVWAR